ncbi:MAG: hypothetical protein C4542_02380 [Dehalococcoidia bacterium]|nr:MAG: hypothetical protein C4542_02380 [Dehalococcoidia bacterium]
MKLGPLEIIVILIIVGVILLVFRGMPGRKAVAPPPPAPPPPIRVRRPTATEIEEECIKASRRNRLRWLGGAFVVIGIILLAGTFKAFNFIFMMSTGAGLIILLGIVVLFLSARR